jgi:hypothetical protein
MRVSLPPLLLCVMGTSAPAQEDKARQAATTWQLHHLDGWA